MLTACIALAVFNTLSVWLNLDDLEDSNLETSLTWDAINVANLILINMVDAETAVRGYLISSNESFLEPLERSRAESTFIRSELIRLRDQGIIAADNTSSILESVDREYQALDELVQVVNSDQMLDSAEVSRAFAGKVVMDELRARIDRVQERQHGRLSEINERTYDSFQIAAYVGVGTGAITTLGLLLFYFDLRRNIERRTAAEAELKAANATLESAVVKRTEQLTRLSRHLIQLSEKEKATLASELHDEFGANLTAINLDVSVVAAKIKDSQPQLYDRLQRALGVLRESVDLKRRIIHGLRPSMLDSLGLAAVIEMISEEFTERTGIPCRTALPENMAQPPDDIAIAIFRVVQESLNNIAKYAQASNVSITMTQGDWLRLTITDDGVGIPADIMNRPVTHGLLGMQERMKQLQGIFKVDTPAGGRGTIVRAEVPLI
ncbi:MAG: CHASE3 domain-containing protein [Gammaproteobacteria bacterium]|nr:CHASE3 domain-containing protein [Gammaproteobacteria bacterium]